MTLRIYNSLTKQKEEFKPLKKGEVKMYVCGPTVYDEPHIGHLRSAYAFDVMRRYLEYSGHKVTFVRNVTDVDDKIIEKARQNNPSDLLTEVRNVSEKYLNAYKKDLEALGIQEPTKEPKATEHVKDMVWLIERLIKNGQAYESQGDVYFDVNVCKDYGKLSHQKKEEMLENVRLDPNEKKRNPLDFALWKEAKEGEPSWDGPIKGKKGRPGWHIECSAMSMKYLGETFDIHGGGRDLIFPHHENEIAQSEGVTGSPFARCWVHHGLVTVDEQKMSKSLKNYVTLNRITNEYSEGVVLLKLLFLGTHYTAPLDFSETKMKMEQSILKRFVEFFYNVEEKRDKGFMASKQSIETFRTAFIGCMDNDFNTPDAMTWMHGLLNMAYKNEEPTQMLSVAAAICEISQNVFGLSFQDLLSGSFDEKAIMEYIHRRNQAKKGKNFKLADQIRDQLVEQGIELMDRSDGTTTWRRKI